MTRRPKILVHYNGNWLPKKQSDTYSGNDLQFVVLPDKYTLEDVKRKVMGLHGFSQGPDFNIYGLVHVDVIDSKKRLLIADEDSLTSYVEEALRVPSFFVVQSEKGRVHGTPTTPSTSLRCPQITTPLTPPTDHRMSSSDNDDSNSERCNGDGIGAANVPKAKRRLVQPDDRQSPMKFPRLHDAPSTPAPKTDCSPPPVVEKRVWYELCVGKRFKTKGNLRIAIGINRIVEGWEHLGVKTNPQVLSVKCKDPACKWTMTAKKMKSLTWWEITRMGPPHNCTENNTNHLLPKRGLARPMAELFKKQFARCDSVYTPRQLLDDMRTEYGVPITYRQGYSGCLRGSELIRGSPDDSYQYLVGYSHMLEQYNPGTKTAIETDANHAFLYYFFAIGVCLNGFKAWCRPAFAVDGTHLYGEHKGFLLSAIGYDANENMFPIAFAIVDSENDQACEWFMQKLFEALGPEYSMQPGLVVCSDRSGSFFKAIQKVFPAACHVYCAYHIKANILKRFKNVAAAETFMRAAKAYTVDDYLEAMGDLKKFGEAIIEYVREIAPRKWARVKAKSARFTLMTTNICESWNSRILDARSLPISHLVDFIRRLLMEWFSERRQLAGKSTYHLSDHAKTIISGWWELAKSFVPILCEKDVFEVHEGDDSLDQHRVELKRKTCTCGVFNYEHLPCPHVLAISQRTKVNMFALCGEYYLTARWRAMYAHAIYPILCQDRWDVPEEVSSRIVKPPNSVPIDLGRRKRKRYRSVSKTRAKSGKKGVVRTAMWKAIIPQPARMYEITRTLF